MVSTGLVDLPPFVQHVPYSTSYVLLVFLGRREKRVKKSKYGERFFWEITRVILLQVSSVLRHLSDVLRPEESLKQNRLNSELLSGITSKDLYQLYLSHSVSRVI